MEILRRLGLRTTEEIDGEPFALKLLRRGGAAPFAAMNSDAILVTKIETTRLFHSSVSAGATEVIAKDVLRHPRSDAGSPAQKDLTTKYAKNVDGVKAVKNEIVVSTPSTKTLSASDKTDDASITGGTEMKCSRYSTEYFFLGGTDNRRMAH